VTFGHLNINNSLLEAVCFRDLTAGAEEARIMLANALNPCF
jgi:hypothetical protein